ncbi:MAG: hypothetical protein ISQ92_06035 [Pelagibacteraceae bacterium]|nr:hypothetical protein [Pelagibacteraceae bacterium]
MKKILSIILVSLMWCSISIAETKNYPNGDKYIGELKNGKRDGQGTLDYRRFQKYVGNFKDDKRHGQGTFIDEGLTEFTYIGEWKDDKKNGLGLITYKKGLKYKGVWKDDKENGKGTLTLPNGKSYDGDFKDGVGFFGKDDPFVYDNSETFYGKYKDGKKHGQGTLILVSGKKFPGIWENGKLTEIQEASLNDSVLLQKGHTLKNNGYLDGAVLFYKKSLEVDPNFRAAKSSLETVLQELSIGKNVNLLDPVCQKNSDDFEIIKFCLDKHFFYQKHPIHPELISDFIPGYADSGDIIISINLTDAFGTNQYSLLDKYETELKEGRSVVSIDDPDGNGYFVYNYLGSTDNGAMVLMTYSSGGGTGIFPELLIIKVKKRLGANHDLFNSEGVVLDKQQVVLEKLLSISLGDRTENSIAINGNTVSVNDKAIKIPSY